MKAMFKDALILFVITLITGVLLGGVYQITKAPIERQVELAEQNACTAVFAEATNFDVYDRFDAAGAEQMMNEFYPSQTIDGVIIARDDAGNDLGYVLNVTTHEGYGGDISFMMGVTLDGTLNGISLLSISETAGLGMQAEDVLVPQFANKHVTSFTYTKNGALDDSEIDAISGATITTNAVTNGVNAGLYYFYNGLGGN